MYITEFEALGTRWWIKIFDNISPLRFHEVESNFRYLITEFENNYSRFLPHSFISFLNEKGSLDNPSKELLNMLQYSEKIRKFSDSHFNISVGGVLEYRGYDKSYSFRRNDNFSKYKLKSPFLKLSSEKIILNTDVHIDLGGFGKGWIIDKVKNWFFENEIQYFQINAGGDIYGSSMKGKPIKITLENPLNTREMIGYINIMNQALACSSPNRRRWINQNNSKQHNHLVLKGKSSSDIAAVFTLAEDALTADTMSTLIYVSPFSVIEKLAGNIRVEFMLVMNSGEFLQSSGYSAVLF